MPSMHEMENDTVRKIEDTAWDETKRIEKEMLIIMSEDQENVDQYDMSNNSFSSAFSRIRPNELNDMGYGLSKISPIMFEGDIFQTPKNKTQEAAPISTPRKNRDSSINKTSPVKQLQRHEEQPKSGSYDAEWSVTGDRGMQPLGRFIPPHHADNFAGKSMDNSQNTNQMMNLKGKSTGESGPGSAGMQTSQSGPAHTTTEGTQMMPPCEKQGLQDHNHTSKDPHTHNTEGKGKGKKSNKKKSSQEAPPQPGTSTAGVVPRTEFQSRNLGTGRPIIQCTAFSEYTHWRRGGPYKFSVQLATVMTMQHICAEHLGTHLSGVPLCVCTAVAVSTAQHNATTDHRITGNSCILHQKRLDRDFNRSMAKFWVMHSQIHVDTQEDDISRDCRA